MRLEDFDYRRNLNDRFLTDILDAKKVVLYDDLKIFAVTANQSITTNHDQSTSDTTHVAVEKDFIGVEK